MRISDWSSDVCSSDLFRRREKATETATDHERLDRLVDRVADQRAVDIRIVDGAAKVAGHPDNLAVSLGVEPLGAFHGIVPATELDLEPNISHGLWQCRHTHPSHSLCRFHPQRWQQVKAG